MGHKSKADRQREANERMRAREVPQVIADLEQAMQYAESPRHDSHDIDRVWVCARRLVEKMRRTHGRLEAIVELRRVLYRANPGTWVPGPNDIDAVILAYLERKVLTHLERKVRVDNARTALGLVHAVESGNTEHLRPHQREFVEQVRREEGRINLTPDMDDPRHAVAPNRNFRYGKR